MKKAGALLMTACPEETYPYKFSSMTTDDPGVTLRFNEVLGETVEAMEESGIRWAFIGGIASGGLGRPRSTRDIDLFVKPEDADEALRALARHGFTTEKTDASWLFKAFKRDILVDVIFKSKGEIYLDNEMFERLITAEYHGKRVKLVAPEDLLIIKAVAHSELTPSHWHDATALLSHSNIDWDYLLKRARRAPRRVLSLLLYAQSNDLWVPNRVIHELYRTVFGEEAPAPARPRAPNMAPTPVRPQAHAATPAGAQAQAARNYVVPHLRECLAEDPRTAELDILIEQDGDRILLRGEVMSEERKARVEATAREKFPDFRIESQLRVLKVGGPSAAESMGDRTEEAG